VLDEKPADPIDVLETALMNKKAGSAGSAEVVGPPAVRLACKRCKSMLALWWRVLMPDLQLSSQNLSCPAAVYR
jgi:hypothetical protein